jgi:hypothetical protein
VKCAPIRERLPEHALGVTLGRDREAVDRHLEWCAACRKESRDLERASATLAFTPAPVVVPADLEDRVVAAVQAAAGASAPDGQSPRRGRTAVSVVLAAALAVAGLGWGAVMAGRASRIEDRAAQEADATAESLSKFALLFRSTLADPETMVSIGTLAPVRDGGGGGAAMTIVTPSEDDHAIVILTALPAEGAPYTISMKGAGGTSTRIGRLDAVDPAGAGTVSRALDRDLGRFHTVIVRDARDRVVLRGPLEAETSFPTPAP